jgi:serine protease Do
LGESQKVNNQPDELSVMNNDRVEQPKGVCFLSRSSGLLLATAIALLSGLLLLRFLSGPSPAGSEPPRTYLADVASGSTGVAHVPGIDDSRRTAIVRAAQRVGPAVVSISVIQVRVVRTGPFGGFSQDPMFQYFFPELQREYRQQIQNMGSGFIIDDQGHILTNEHVVENASEIVVNLADGRQFPADLLGSDPALDLALLKVDGKDLPSAPLGDSDDLIIGEWAIAIGNPYGYILEDSRPSVTVGVISAIGRNFDPRRGRIYRNMVQTDAAINPGNSGGPLVNSVGQVIGINTFIFTESGGSLGVGFAIPINTAKRMLDEIITYGKVRPFWTGIHIQSLTPAIAQSLGYDSTDGVLVSQLDPDSPARQAGLRVGDIVVAFNDRPIRDENDLVAEFYEAHVGDRITLQVWRQGQIRTVAFTLTEPQQHD